MEPNNIENKIKEKLNAREIQPSANSWDRLDAMLTVAENKKAKPSRFLSFQFIAIAASVIVFLSAGLYFFNTEKRTINSNNTIVTNEVTIDSVQLNNSKQESDKKNILNTNIQQLVQTTTNSNIKKINTNTNSSKQINSNKEEVSIINQNQINQKTIATNNQEVVMLNQPKKEAIITSPKNIVVNPEELLTNVETLVKTKKSEAKIKVNANSLLSQVDGELEQTFRQKVINKIGKNYQEAKLALANRNQE